MACQKVTAFFYGEGQLLASALVALICELLWVGVLSTIMFGLLKLTGLLRVSKEVEEAGLDESKHGGKGYNTSATDSKSSS